MTDTDTPLEMATGTRPETKTKTDLEMETSNIPIPAPLLTLPNSLSIRSYHTNDTANLVAGLSDPRVRKSLRNHLPDPYTTASAEYWISQQFAARNMKRAGPWPWVGADHEPESSSQDQARSSQQLVPMKYAIAQHGHLVGGITLAFQDEGDVYARTAEIGYWLLPSHWGRGIMSVVVRAYVDWAFGVFGILNRVEACVFQDNQASIKVLGAAGFVVEGVRKGAVWKEGRLEDDVLLARVRGGDQD